MIDGFCGEGTAINSFSLVAYVPQPLAGFIERLRQEIQPGCTARSHLTFLPPRLLEIPVEQIRVQLEAGLRDQVKIIVGGTPVNEQVREYAGADYYAKDAVAGVNMCKEIYS